MSASIISEDFLSVCLVLAKGDLNTTLEEVICRAESFQGSEDRHFGISRKDFRNAINMLSFQTYHELGLGNGEEMLKAKPLLKDWTSPILKYEYVHFNDEGERWCPYENDPSKLNLKMRGFLDNPFNHKEGSIMLFLYKRGKIPSILSDCSRSGSWS